MKRFGRIVRILLIATLTAFLVAAGGFMASRRQDGERPEPAPDSFIETEYTDAEGFTVRSTVEKGEGLLCIISLPETGCPVLDAKCSTLAAAHRRQVMQAGSGTLRVTGITYRLAQFVSVHMTLRHNSEITEYTWACDADSGLLYTLDDFFEEGVDIPALLAPVCREALAAESGGEATPAELEATEPIPENYSLFTLSSEGIYLFFSAHRLGLAGGARRILIEHDSVADAASYHIPSTGEPLLWKRDLPKGLPPADRPYKIALTFDDGPSATTTGKLLDGLARRGVKATFFMLGTNAERNPKTAARAAAEGHELGNHSYGHPRLTGFSAAAIADEMERSRAAIEKASGVSPTLARPPYGASSSLVLANLGLPAILWSVDVGDWKYRDAAYIADATVDVVKDGDIILMHDIYDTSVEAALSIIDRLSDMGYSFVTVSELMESRGVELEAGKKYYYARQ